MICKKCGTGIVYKLVGPHSGQYVKDTFMTTAETPTCPAGGTHQPGGRA